MIPKLPLDERIYTLTAGRVLNTQMAYLVYTSAGLTINCVFKLKPRVGYHWNRASQVVCFLVFCSMSIKQCEGHSLIIGNSWK